MSIVGRVAVSLRQNQCFIPLNVRDRRWQTTARSASLTLRQNSNAPRAKWSMVLHDFRFKPTMYALQLWERVRMAGVSCRRKKMPNWRCPNRLARKLPGRIDQWSGWNAFCLAVPACRV